MQSINKWQLFRELCVAKTQFGLGNRNLTVLNALLSFHQSSDLSQADNLVVFPSNAKLAERAHGMPESTLRRHLATLVSSGLIRRHDSPNGKRYARRDGDGSLTRAFGFDLRPLLEQAEQIITAAIASREVQDQQKNLREDIALMKRDAIKLAVFGQSETSNSTWGDMLEKLAEIQTYMRRKLPLEDLISIKQKLGDILQKIQSILLPDTKKMSPADDQNERHFHNSNKDSYESEQADLHSLNLEATIKPNQDSLESHEEVKPAMKLPLHLVLRAVPDILPYAQDPPQDWHQMLKVADFVRGMMGISQETWNQAKQTMGPSNAAITLACILQRVTDIKSPGGYLRVLTKKAGLGKFSPVSMVMALLNTQPEMS